MRLTANRVTLLLAHGLSDSEARVYLTLLDHSNLAAATLAKAAQVPRSHLYTVLQELHGRGLVDILLDGKSRTYRARPLSAFLGRQADEMRARLVEIETQRQSIAQAFEPPPMEPSELNESGEFRLVIGRRAFAREIQDLLDTAAKSVIISCSEGSPERVGKHLAAWLGTANRESEVAVTVFLPPGVPAEALGPGVEMAQNVIVAWLNVAMPTLALVKDGREFLMSQPIPDVADMRSGRDFGIFTTNPAFVATFLLLLESQRFGFPRFDAPLPK